MADGTPTMNTLPLVDRYGRQVTYLRMSVTDRCDLRCSYCMSEKMTFLPKAELLSFDELDQVATAFVRRGVTKLRLTGGEPLVRKDFADLVARLGRHLGAGLEELTLTTNGTLLEGHADGLVRAGVRRINVSLDSLAPDRFAEITRRGQLAKVLAGIDAALDAGLKVKINTVALKHQNADEIPSMVEWAHGRGMDMTLIEVMPLGETGEDRVDQYIPLPMIRDRLEARWSLVDEPHISPNAGPSRYARVQETGGRLGFITPLTNNFCAGCNRVRVTCTGRVYMCLGQDDHVDLRAALRDMPDPVAALDAALDRALLAKPEKHDFEIKRRGTAPALPRHMSMTGG
ncbi:GTP 3',8-cyclase MoaA [Hyphomonas johnsonii]|uniref:GTP 3',8-cyclase n=1 Tax=Hyphomonas johnsonii MHS-2 TaxID=1280950 RepID=A0A059FS68_9PROT|nr:GTP 3',8-cyclase MoaA [Hyphomonas johnsonii]KCZ93366.1 molybdenum cofactor biosynthesis protein MoaA [Hyphomonas johnsonii MHS-2]